MLYSARFLNLIEKEMNKWAVEDDHTKPKLLEEFAWPEVKLVIANY